MNAVCPFAIKQILEDSTAPVHRDVARAMECKLIEHQQKLKKSTCNLVYNQIHLPMQQAIDYMLIYKEL